MIQLDTSVLIWLRSGHRRLGAETSEILERAWVSGRGRGIGHLVLGNSDAETEGRLALAGDVNEWRKGLIQNGLNEIAVDGQIGARAAVLADFHPDPADRIIVATALESGCPLVTSDRRILGWSGPLHRIPAGV